MELQFTPESRKCEMHASLSRVSALLVKLYRKQLVHEGGEDRSNLIYLGYSGVMFGHSVGLVSEIKRVF